MSIEEANILLNDPKRLKSLGLGKVELKHILKEH
mgnify:CR=1 FL=1